MKTIIQNNQILISNILFVAIIAAVVVMAFTLKLTVYFDTL